MRAFQVLNVAGASVDASDTIIFRSCLALLSLAAPPKTPRARQGCAAKPQGDVAGGLSIERCQPGLEDSPGGLARQVINLSKERPYLQEVLLSNLLKLLLRHGLCCRR